jgi:hypothetical protein
MGFFISSNSNIMATKAERIIASCKKHFTGYNIIDCNAFAKAVAADFGVVFTGNADSIVDQIEGDDWIPVKDSFEAKEKADAGYLVVVGIRGKDYVPAKNNGHVAIVVSGPLDTINKKYPMGYWGQYKGKGKPNESISQSFNKASLAKVTYACREIPEIPLQPDDENGQPMGSIGLLELKKNIVRKNYELPLDVFGESFAAASPFFDDLKFNINDAEIISERADAIRVKASSKDFLFARNILRNDSVDLEIEFKNNHGSIDIFSICRLNKVPKKLSKLPGTLGDILRPLDFLEIDDLGFILTSSAQKEIHSEAFPKYDGRKAELSPGINVVGFIDLAKSGNLLSEVLKPLKPILGKGPYFLSWNLRNKANVGFTLDIPQDISIANIFNVQQPRLVINAKGPEVSIDGQFKFQFPGLPEVAVAGGFTYAPNAIRGRFNLDHWADKIPAPFGYPGIHLETLRVHAGIINGTPMLGAEGRFFIGPEKPPRDGASSGFGDIRTNEFKVLYTAVPGKVTPYFAWLYLDQLSLEDYIRALSNINVTLPSFMNKVLLRQLMMHWCESPAGEMKPDGTIAMPLFGFSAIADVFGLKAFADVKADTAGNSRGIFVLDPINIGNLLKIGGNGKGTPEKYKGATRISPGGMEMQFNSDGKPVFISFSGSIEILGLSGAVEGQVSDDALSGKVKSSIAGIIRNELTLHLRQDAFDVETQMEARIDGLKVSLGNLGNIRINSALEGNFEASFRNNNYTNSMRLSFELLGIRFDLGTLSVDIRDLKNIVAELEQFIRDVVIQTLTTDVLKWLAATLENVIEFAGDRLQAIGLALKDVFHQSQETAAQLMKQVGYEAREAGEALLKGYQQTTREVAAALKQAGYMAEDVGEFLLEVTKISGDAAAGILHAIGYTYTEVGHALKNVFHFTDDAVAAALKQVGAGAEVIAAHLKDAAKLGAGAIGSILKNLGYANDVIAASLRTIKFDAKQVGDVLTDVLKVGDNVAKEILGKIGFKAPEIELKFPSTYIKSPYVKRPYIKGFIKL